MGVRENIKRELDSLEYERVIIRMDEGLKYLKDNFCDLSPIIKRKNTYYVNQDNTPIFMVEECIHGPIVYVDSKKTWEFFAKERSMKFYEVLTILTEWLEESYDLKDVLPKIRKNFSIKLT